jgi:hypothetical protein
MYMCLKISFVEPVMEEFLFEKKPEENLFIFFYLSMRFQLLKPLGFEGCIHMCGGHLLGFLNCQICHKEGGEVIVNLQHR